MKDSNTSEKTSNSLPAPEAATPAAPTPFKKPRVKRTPEQRKRESQSAKEKRLEARRLYIQQLIAEGKLSVSEGVKLGKESGVEVNVPEVLESFRPEQDSSIQNDSNVNPNISNGIANINAIMNSRGQIPTIFGDSEKQTFLEFLSTGIGVAATLRAMKTGYNRYKTTLTSDANFKEQVQVYEDSLEGLCAGRIFEAAMMGDQGAASRFLQYRTSSKSSAFERRMRIQEVKLRKQAVEAQIGALTQNQRPSFACLTNEELEDYANINEKVRLGQSLDPEALARLGLYTAKLMQANSPKLEKPAADFIDQEANRPIGPAIEAKFTEESSDETKDR